MASKMISRFNTRNLDYYFMGYDIPYLPEDLQLEIKETRRLSNLLSKRENMIVEELEIKENHKTPSKDLARLTELREELMEIKSMLWNTETRELFLNSRRHEIEVELRDSYEKSFPSENLSGIDFSWALHELDRID